MSDHEVIFERNNMVCGDPIDLGDIDLSDAEVFFSTEEADRSASSDKQREVYELNCFGFDPNKF